jgi:hypothetical protein
MAAEEANNFKNYPSVLAGISENKNRNHVPCPEVGRLSFYCLVCLAIHIHCEIKSSFYYPL